MCDDERIERYGRAVLAAQERRKAFDAEVRASMRPGETFSRARQRLTRAKLKARMMGGAIPDGSPIVVVTGIPRGDS